MDQRTPYEIIIAEKLQSIAVPDMADQIWSRVKFQLDIDMPSDDDKDPQGGGDIPAFPGFYFGGIGLVVLAAILLLFNTNPTHSKSDLQNIIAPGRATKPEARPVFPGNRKPDIIRANSKAVIQDREAVRESSGSVDSISLSGNTFPIERTVDSVLTDPIPGINPGIPIETPTREPDRDSSIVPPKKKRGIPGITESDYRIIPKKNEQQP